MLKSMTVEQAIVKNVRGLSPRLCALLILSDAIKGDEGRQFVTWAISCWIGKVPSEAQYNFALAMLREKISDGG